MQPHPSLRIVWQRWRQTTIINLVVNTSSMWPLVLVFSLGNFHILERFCGYTCDQCLDVRKCVKIACRCLRRSSCTRIIEGSTCFEINSIVVLDAWDMETSERQTKVSGMLIIAAYGQEPVFPKINAFPIECTWLDQSEFVDVCLIVRFLLLLKVYCVFSLPRETVSNPRVPYSQKLKKTYSKWPEN